MERYNYYQQQLIFFYDTFIKAKNENKIIKITTSNKFDESILIDMDNSKENDFDEIFFSIDKCEIVNSGCNKCKNSYNDICFSGNYYCENRLYQYTGIISSYYIMCKCDLEDEQWNNFDNDVYLVCKIYPNGNTKRMVFVSDKMLIELVDKLN